MRVARSLDEARARQDEARRLDDAKRRDAPADLAGPSCLGPACLGPACRLAELEAFGAALPTDGNHGLFRHWLQRWQGGRPPARADILPEELGSLLGRVFLIECEAGSGRLRYRLVGATLAAEIGYDSTGRYLDEVSAGFPEEVRRRWQRRDELGIGEARPVFGRWTLAHLGRSWRDLSTLRLPLIEDGRVTHLVGYGVVD